jgi:signal transduction histidine kinase
MRWFLHSTRAASVAKSWPGRAKRHPLRLPVEYRVSGHTRWNSAVTSNLSCTGALLENAALPLRVGDELELRLVLPPQITGPATVPLLCVARVVRIETAKQNTRVAAAILRSRLEASGSNGHSHDDIDSLRSVRHEVNNALTAIVGCAELLLISDLDELARTQLQQVRDSALRAAGALRRLRQEG